MKATTALVVLLGLPAATLALFERQPALNEWGDSKLSKWLEDHSVPNPGNLNGQQLQDLVKKNYDSIYDSLPEADLASLAKKYDLPVPTAQSQRQKTVRSLRRYYDDTVDTWSDSDLKEWLGDHGIPLPPKAKHEQLLDTVKAHYSSASGYLSSSANDAQKVFQKNSDKAFKYWTDSQLRDYLLDQGVVSPGSAREELVVQARKYYNDAAAAARSASHSASSLAASATGGSYSASLTSAWASATSTPSLAYDYLSETFDDGKDYVYSTWGDSDLKKYLSDSGYTGQVPSRRDDLLKTVQGTYSDAVDNVYETWSDNRLKDWLAKHGVVEGKKAASRDELVDLVSRNYYGARDTTYNLWSKNQLRSWLEARGLIKTGTEKKRDDYLSLVSDKYYSLRDSAYSAYDDNTLRSYLDSQGVTKGATDEKRDELLKNVKETWYTANDKVWDTWSDSEMKDWLSKNKVVEKKQATGLRRDKLEKYLEESWSSARSNVESSWTESQAREWLQANGYIKSDAQLKRDQLFDLIGQNYHSTASKSGEWLTWSDARLRGWLRSAGVNVPMSSNRGELEQRMRENYVSTQSGLSDLLHYVQSYIASGVHVGQNSIEEALAVLKGAVGGAAGKVGADEGEQGAKGAYRTASRSLVSATASIKNEL